jgi:hypothetical protein
LSPAACSAPSHGHSRSRVPCAPVVTSRPTYRSQPNETERRPLACGPGT